MNKGGKDDDCVSGLAGFDFANVAARRIPLVDDEQVGPWMAVFIRKPDRIRLRNAFSEWFWIEDGKIRNIWTAMYYPGPETPGTQLAAIRRQLPVGRAAMRRRAELRPTTSMPRSRRGCCRHGEYAAHRSIRHRLRR